MKAARLYSFIPRNLKEEVRNIKGLFGRSVDSPASNSRTLSPGASRIDQNPRRPKRGPSEDSMVIDATAWGRPVYCQGHLWLNQQNELPSTFPAMSMEVIDISSASSAVQPPHRQDSMQSIKTSSPSFSLRQMSLDFPFRKCTVRSSSQMSVDGLPCPAPLVHPHPRDPERSLVQQAEQFLKGISDSPQDLPTVPHQGGMGLQSGDPPGSLDSSQPMAWSPPPSNDLEAKHRFSFGDEPMGKTKGLEKIRSLLSRSKEPVTSYNSNAVMAKPYSRPIISSFSRRPFLSGKRGRTLEPLDPYVMGLDGTLDDAFAESRSTKPCPMKRPRLRRRQDSTPSSLLFAPPSAKGHCPPEEKDVLSRLEPSTATNWPHTIEYIFHPHPKGQRKTPRRQRSPSIEVHAGLDNRRTDRKKKRVRLDSWPSPVVGPNSQVNMAPTPERQLSLIQDLSLPRPFEEQPRQARQPRSSKMKGYERRRAGVAVAAAVYTGATKVRRNGRRGRLRASSEPPGSFSRLMEPVDNEIRVSAIKPSRSQHALPPALQSPVIFPDPSFGDSSVPRCDSPDQIDHNGNGSRHPSLPAIFVTHHSVDSTSTRRPIRRTAGDDGPRRESSDEVDFDLGDANDLRGFLVPVINDRGTAGTLESFASLWDALRDIEAHKKAH
ncbi:hypothetical protein BS17DRAFT_33681 [Gyrodon lividus]|nr:hypothetical protein BS17DRAFT_33681 [Gyrodon lividus]